MKMFSIFCNFLDLKIQLICCRTLKMDIYHPQIPSKIKKNGLTHIISCTPWVDLIPCNMIFYDSLGCFQMIFGDFIFFRFLCTCARPCVSFRMMIILENLQKCMKLHDFSHQKHINTRRKMVVIFLLRRITAPHFIRSLIRTHISILSKVDFFRKKKVFFVLAVSRNHKCAVVTGLLCKAVI